jgi:hypothetical protein
LDGYAASHRGVRELKADDFLPAETRLRSSKYPTDIFDKFFFPFGAIVIGHG